MNVRFYKPEDINEISELFYNTVHKINNRDYDDEQLNAWADGNLDKIAWNESLMNHYSLVVVDENKIVGFADLDESYLDRLYVSFKYQGRGVATLLCDALEAQAQLNKADKIETHASITAVPFFEKRGYKIIKRQTVVRRNVSLENYVMQKELIKKLV